MTYWRHTVIKHFQLSSWTQAVKELSYLMSMCVKREGGKKKLITSFKGDTDTLHDLPQRVVVSQTFE